MVSKARGFFGIPIYTFFPSSLQQPLSSALEPPIRWSRPAKITLIGALTRSHVPLQSCVCNIFSATHGVGAINLFPSLSIDNVLYVLNPHLTYYLLVVSPVSLIVLFLLPKLLFAYRTGVQDRW